MDHDAPLIPDQPPSGVSHGLLERREELAQVEVLLDHADAGRGGTLLVRGEPGIGKTAILRFAAERGEDRGWAVRRSRGTHPDASVAWGAAYGLFAPPVGEQPEPAASLAARLADPLLRGGTGDGTVPRNANPATVGDARAAVEHGLHWRLVDLAAAGPLVLCVDDAHWADLASLGLLVHLAHRLDDAPIVLLVAARPAADDEREALLARIAVAPRARHARPAPLSRAAITELVARRGGLADADRVAAACERRTGGNPFLVEELLGELGRLAGDRADVDVDALRPEGVGRSVAGRLATVGADGTALACAVVVLGPRAQLRLAAAVAGLDPERAAIAADALRDCGVLAAERALEVVHPLVEEAIRAAIRIGELGRLHRRAFDALVADGARPALAALHLLDSEPTGCGEVVDVLCAAGSEAIERGDAGTAVRLFERAAAESHAAAADPVILHRIGLALLADEQHAEGLERLEAARAITPGPRERAAIDLRLALARYEHGDVPGARAAVRRGLAEPLEAGDPTIGALRAAGLVASRAVGDEGPTAADVAAARDEHGAGRTGPERLLLSQLAFHALQTGEVPHTDVVDLAGRAVRAAADAREPLDDLALPLAGMALYHSDAHAPAEEAFTEAADRAAGGGSGTAVATALFFRGASRYLRGALLGAIDDWEVTLAAAEEGWAFALPSLRGLRAHVALERDDPGVAEQLLVLPGGDAPWSSHPTFPHLLAARGFAAAMRGAPDEALVLLLDAGRRLDGSGVRNPAVVHWQSEAAVAALATDDHGLARRLAEDLAARTEAYGAPRGLGLGRRTRALVDPGADGAGRDLDDAVAAFAAAGAHLELARTRLEQGAALRRGGRRGAAVDALTLALDGADRCGATVVAARARDELRVAGARPRRARVSGAESLTAGERRVARLAAAGLANRAIAQRLFLTLRTVETHLTHTYAKLDVDRGGLADALGDADGPDAG